MIRWAAGGDMSSAGWMKRWTGGDGGNCQASVVFGRCKVREGVSQMRLASS